MSEICTEIYIGENGNWYINGKDTGESSRGQDGLSAYQVALRNNYKGTEKEWLESLKGQDGKSAYEIAFDLGYQGTFSDWPESLKGEAGLTPHIGENGNWILGDKDTGILADVEKAVQNKFPLRKSVTGVTTKYGNLELGIDPKIYVVISISSCTEGLMCIPYINTEKTQWAAHIRSSGSFSAYADYELTVEVVYMRKCNDVTRQSTIE